MEWSDGQRKIAARAGAVTSASSARGDLAGALFQCAANIGAAALHADSARYTASNARARLRASRQGLRASESGFHLAQPYGLVGISRRLHVDANPARGTHRFALLARRSTASPFWCRRRAFTATATSARRRERLLTGYFPCKRKRQELAGQRPSFPAVATGTARLHLSLLRDLQRVVHLDAEVSDSTLKFALTQEKLDGPEIPGAPIDQRRFRTPQRMRAVGSRIRSNRRHPTPDDSGILARRKMRRLRNAARKYELIRLEMSGRYPSAHCVPRLLGPFRIAPAAEVSSA